MLLAMAVLLIPPLVEMIEIDGTDKLRVIVDNRCEFVIDKQDVDHNYPKIEQIMLDKCFREDTIETEKP